MGTSIFYWDDSAGKSGYRSMSDSEFLLQTSLPSGLGSRTVLASIETHNGAFLYRKVCFVLASEGAACLESNYDIALLTDNAAKGEQWKSVYKVCHLGFYSYGRKQWKYSGRRHFFPCSRDALQVTKS